uniref:Uncharacterized protein n=1 Tax=Meloidogyne enterolobii TaxID=390850 RepID=A0A6V7X599_MELEN|nr:unnamed protein product [Meloidogyne enterolobii]
MTEATQQPNENTNATNTTFYIEHQRVSVNDIGNHVGDANPRFGVVRDRLFHAMLVCSPFTSLLHKFSSTFSKNFEFLTLFNALVFLSILIYTHFLAAHYPANCLNEIKQTWPLKGIVRIEIVHDNLPKFKNYMLRTIDKEEQSSGVCRFDEDFYTCFLNPAEVLKGYGLPSELKNPFKTVDPKNLLITSQPDRVKRPRKFLFPFMVDYFYWVMDKFRKFQQIFDEDFIFFKTDVQHEKDENGNFEDSSSNEYFPIYSNLFEFSLHYGLLRLNSEMRQELGVNIMDVQLDIRKDKCLKDWRDKPLMRLLIGIDELVMSSVKQLSENQTERGYLRDLINGELYHFVNVGETSASRYLTALFVMLIFTFAISMLLRFSHDQIFVFIVDLFQMFEQNQPLIFPIAPLLTVILALVGMEAIMSEIFNDTTTAFYVILFVWMADQYDAIFCHSSIGRRYWLRFFYLYHFAFYAYQYHYNGVYSSLALLTSAAFTLHSMVYFFHHYELPYIIYQERLINAVRRINTENGDGNVDLVRIRQVNENRTARITSQNGNNTLRNTNIENRSSNDVSTTIRGAVEILENIAANEPNNQDIPTSTNNLEQTNESLTTSVAVENQSFSSNLPSVENMANSIVDEAIQEAESFVSSLETQRRLQNI